MIPPCVGLNRVPGLTNEFLMFKSPAAKLNLMASFEHSLLLVIFPTLSQTFLTLEVEHPALS